MNDDSQARVSYKLDEIENNASNETNSLECLDTIQIEHDHDYCSPSKFVCHERVVDLLVGIPLDNSSANIVNGMPLPVVYSLDDSNVSILNRTTLPVDT